MTSENQQKPIKKKRKAVFIAIPIVAVLCAFVIVLLTVIIPSIKYNAALELYNAEKYTEAYAAFDALNGYKDSKEKAKKCIKISGMKFQTITDGSVVITGCTRKMSYSIFIPSMIGGKNVSRIGSSSFSGFKCLKSVFIANSVTSIGDKAFMGCSTLKSVTIPDSVTSIGEMAFGYYITDNGDIVKVDGFTIYGKNGSAAEQYAKDNDFSFEISTV